MKSFPYIFIKGIGGISLQFYYGSLMPLRIIDEIEFWKQQEEEHTVVIRSLVENLEQPYVNQLKEWEHALTQTHQTSVRYVETLARVGENVNQTLFQQMMHFVSYCLNQSLQFIKFCQMMKVQSKAISSNSTAKVVMDHIVRESEYFVGIAQTLLYSK